MGSITMRSHAMRRFALAAIFCCACGDNKPNAATHPDQPITRTTTAAALDSLPRLDVTDGRLVCLAVGQAPCPTTAVTANWLRDGKYATWEFHRPIEIWTPNKTDPEFLGSVGDAANQYDVVLSVAETQTGFTVISYTNKMTIQFDRAGRYLTSLPLPPVSTTHNRGYSGDVSFYQLIREGGQDSAAIFEVRTTIDPGDTVGHSLINVPLPWLRLHDGRPMNQMPLFPTLPSYAFAPDSDIVWASGDTIAAERRSSTGALRWKLTSDVPGPVITPAALKVLRDKLAQDDKAKLAGFDSSAARTGKSYPAVTGLFVAPDGRVVLVGPQVPVRDSTDFLVLDKTGLPAGRFAMPNRTRPLLFAGDSILVHRAGANAQPELRWLVLKTH